MILTCPDCASSYFVPDEAMKAPRQVRCTACGKSWRAEPEATLELVSTPEEGAVAQDPAQVAGEAEPAAALADLPGDALPKVYRARADAERKMKEAAGTGIIWAGMAAVLVLVAVSAVVFRVDMVRIFPRTAGAFASVGLPVNQVGLVIEQLKAEPSLQDGHAALTISGVLRNIEDHTVEAPPLRLSLLNPAGKRVGGKVAAAADPNVPPGETRHFAIAIIDPPSTAKDLEIGFVLDAGAAKAVKSAAPPNREAKLSLRGSTDPAAPPAPAAPHVDHPAPKPASQALGAAPAAETGPAPQVIDAKPLPADSPLARSDH